MGTSQVAPAPRTQPKGGAEDSFSRPPPSGPEGVSVNQSSPGSLREGADRVARILRDSGYQAYFAGGCVRDRLLGLEPKDFDITTDARPEQVARLFRRTIMVGAAFGVVKVVLGKGRDYEVATFRADGEYADGRRPKDVVYATSAKDDVERRDFTINGLLMDPATDEIIDLVQGRPDLEAGLIRAVGEPSLRFSEDRLRMLRAVRFAARFGFEIEPATFAAIQAHAPHLSDVSVERISQELEGIFKSARPGEGFGLLVKTGLLAPAMPFSAHRDGASLQRVQDSLTRLPSACDGLSPEQRVMVAWALVMEGAAAKDADDALRAMKLSREQLRGVKTLLDAQDVLTRMAPEQGAEVLRLFDSPDVACLRAFQAALLGPQSAPVQAAERVVQSLAEAPLPARPLLSGADLKAVGMQPGRHFKAILDAVDVEVLERRVKDKDEALAFVRARPDLV